MFVVMKFALRHCYGKKSPFYYSTGSQPDAATGHYEIQVAISKRHITWGEVTSLNLVLNHADVLEVHLM